MIALPSGTRVWVAAGATDMRKGMDGLAALVQTTLLENAFSGQSLPRPARGPGEALVVRR